jgi:putative PIN family toxin of toxin-antitoxin system
VARLRIVLDTNVLVSGSVYPTSIPGQILQFWRGGALDIVLSRYIIDELARVLPRFPRFEFSADETRDLVNSFLFLADIVEPDTFHEPMLRDAADQQILATLRASNADYLITGDKDLLALAARYPILTPADFWSRHG